MCPLGSRYFLKKVVPSCLKCEITYRFGKTLENTYEGLPFSEVTGLQPATLLKIDSFIDMKQRFQRRIYKNLLHSFNLFVKRRWLLILDLVTGSLKWLNLFKWIVYFTLTFHILRTILAALTKILISNGDIGGLGCVFVFYLGFFSRTFTNHMIAGEGGGHFFNSSLPLSPASQALRH